MTSKTNFLEFSRPFVEAAKKVFETMVFTKLEALKPSIKENNNSLGDISAILGLLGQIKNGNGDKPVEYKAMLVMSFPYETYIKIASAMLMETYAEYNDEISDVGGEICNMVMGNAKRSLSEMGYSCNKAIPSIIVGENHVIKYPSETTTVVIPINSAHGKMYMEICYKELHASEVDDEN